MGTMATPTLAYLPEHSQIAGDQILQRPTIPATAPSSRPGSLRRTKTDVDDAIRELNTIIEERRASAYRTNAQSPALVNRPPPSPSHHVPYIAPSMRMHVRSETLSDIGSAFSAPPELQAASHHPRGRHPSPPGNNGTQARTTFLLPHWSLELESHYTTTTRHTQCTNRPARGLDQVLDLHSGIQLASYNPKTADSLRVRTATRPSHLAFAQESNGTATVTLFSTSYPSTRSSSPTNSLSTVATSSPPRKLRRVPAPLTLVKEKEITAEAGLLSGRSTRGFMNEKPPMSPNFDLLKGMEISAKDVGVNGRRSLMTLSPGAVGVAF
ncbi:unnamed protein product [Alternaria alternata]